jgi:hypothetical protein
VGWAGASVEDVEVVVLVSTLSSDWMTEVVAGWTVELLLIR